MRSDTPGARWVWLVVALLLVTAFAITRPRGASARPHPNPRPGITARGVEHASHYRAYPRVAETYAQAREIPEILDGIHCYCECGSHAGHYSLLDCFKSDHAAGCDVCLSEAAIAHRLHGEGQSLDQIRTAIDNLYGR